MRQKASSNYLNLQSDRLQYMLSSGPLDQLNETSRKEDTIVSSLSQGRRRRQKEDFSMMMVPFLASNKDRSALSGGKGIVNLEKFHLILDEMKKRGSTKEAVPSTRGGQEPTM